MPFLKISDPAKRDAKVKEYLDLKKRVRDNFRRERIGEMEMQSDLTKFFKPITEHKKIQQGRLQKNLNLLKRVSRNYHKLLRFLHIHQ